MARRVRKAAEVVDRIEERTIEDGHGNAVGNTVVVVRVPAARTLATLDEEHGIWKGRGNLLGIGPKETWEGAIVRLRPPPDVDPARVEKVKAILADAGVARIKLETRRGAVLPTEAVQKAKPAKRSSAREIVLQLVKEANSSDPDELRDIVERVMAEEGL